MAMLLVAIVFTFIFAIAGIEKTDASCNERLIVKNIFADYDPNVRPVKSQTTPVIVQFTLWIVAIVDLNEQEETINLIVVMEIIWKDEYLIWNATDPDQNCTEINTRAHHLWIPSVIFINTVETQPILTDDEQWVTLTNEGIVRMSRLAGVTLRCPMSISDFPFDIQNCPINISSWNYQSKYVRFEIDNETNGIGSFPPDSSQFKTLSLDGRSVVSTYSNNKSYSLVYYTLVLKRVPEYYIYVLIIPSFLLTSLCIIGIFTPNSSTNDRSEKVTLGLTTLLSMAVILNIAAGQVPKSSQGLPLLGYYILHEIGMCTLAVILSTIILFVYQKANTRGWDAPCILYWLTSTKPLQNNIVLLSDGEKYLTKNKYSLSTQQKQCNIIEVKPDEDGKVNKIAEIQKIAKELRDALEVIKSKIEQTLHEEEQRKTIEIVWLKCVDLIDTVLLIVLLVANTLLTYFFMW